MKFFLFSLVLIVSLPKALSMPMEMADVDKKQKEEQQICHERSDDDASDYERGQDGSSLEQRGNGASIKGKNKNPKSTTMISNQADFSSSSAMLSLKDFWDAAEQNPRASRFVIDRDNGKIKPPVISIKGMMLNIVKSSDRKKDKAIIDAFKTAAMAEYPGISWSDIWKHGDAKLGAAQIEACKKALAEYPLAVKGLAPFRGGASESLTAGSLEEHEKKEVPAVEASVFNSKEILEPSFPKKTDTHDERQPESEIQNKLDAALPDLRRTIQECKRGTLDWSSSINEKDIKTWDHVWDQLTSLLPITEKNKSDAEDKLHELQAWHQETTRADAQKYLQFFKQQFPKHKEYIDAKRALESTICDQLLDDPRVGEVWIDAAVKRGSAEAREIMAQQYAKIPRSQNTNQFLKQAGAEIRNKVIEAAQKEAQRALSEDKTFFLQETILPAAQEALLKNREAIELNQSIDFTIKNAVKEAFMAAMHEVMQEVVIAAVDSGLDIVQSATRQSGSYRFSQSKAMQKITAPILQEKFVEKTESINSEEDSLSDGDNVWRDVESDNEDEVTL